MRVYSIIIMPDSNDFFIQGRQYLLYNCSCLFQTYNLPQYFHQSLYLTVLKYDLPVLQVK